MKFFLIILVFGSVIVSCNSDNNDSADVEATSYLKTIDKNVSSFEVDKLIEEIPLLFLSEKFKDLNNLVDYKSIISRTVKSLAIEEFKKSFIEGAVKQLEQQTNLFENMAYGFAYYDFIRTYTDIDGFQVIVYRRYGDNGFNFDEYTLANVEGKLKIIDIYDAVTGEYISETLKEFIATLISDKEFLNNYNPEEFKKNISLLADYIQDEEYEKAQQLYNSLPNKVKASKTIQLLEIQIYLGLDDDLYLEKMEAFRSNYPNSSSLDIMSIDYFFVKEEYEKVIEVIENIEKVYPEDGSLPFLKGTIYSYQEKCEEAVKHMEKAINLSPNIDAFHDALTIEYLDCNQKQKAFKTINYLLEIDFYEFVDIDNYLLTYYTDCTSWPEYQAWHKSLNR